jgi:protein-disulfide isomerase
MNDAPETPAEPAPQRRRLTPERGVIVALGLSAVALALAAAPYVTGTGSFDQKVRGYLLEHPEMLQEMSAALQANQDNALADGINQRAAASPALLAVDARDPAFGPVDAKVTVIEFFDFRCPGCKATAPEILRLIEAHPDVRFVFKDWPILDRGTEDISHYAARAAQAAHRQGEYLTVFRALMAQPALDKAAVDRVLAESGVSLPEAHASMQSPDLIRHLADSQTSATALGLVGTPTFFINGKASPSIQPRDIDRAIREAKAA